MGAITQQNSDMVEQSSAETRRLKDEVETLIELLRRFRARPEGRSAGEANMAKFQTGMQKSVFPAYRIIP
ncbi:methyl-accepting chemotaxis protein [Rhizobium laguerreae]|nr:methyl-accepting chemotaxis protein [Rhizobium laguerreae]